MKKLRSLSAGLLLFLLFLGVTASISLQAKEEAVEPYLYLPIIGKLPPVPTVDPIALTCDSNDWTVSWSDGGSLVSEYVLEEAHDLNFTAPQVYTTTATSMAFNYAPSVDNQYYYRVRADGSWGVGEWSAPATVVGAFFDDFSDTSSGWAVSESSTKNLGYQSGQYRIGVKQSGFLISAKAPDAARNGYEAEVTARWASGSATNGIYGLVFGATSDLQKYYFLGVRSGDQKYRLYYFDGTLPQAERLQGITSWIVDGSINSGSAANKLTVRRVGSSIQASINDTALGTWSDSRLTGSSYTGLMATSNPANPAITALFDDFSVSACDTLATKPLSNVVPAEGNAFSVESSEDKVDLDWSFTK